MTDRLIITLLSQCLNENIHYTQVISLYQLNYCFQCLLKFIRSIGILNIA